jgi:hypothetical protein
MRQPVLTSLIRKRLDKSISDATLSINTISYLYYGTYVDRLDAETENMAEEFRL